MKNKEYTLETTTEIEQCEKKVHPAILGVYAILVITCIVYFITHITRPV